MSRKKSDNSDYDHIFKDGSRQTDLFEDRTFESVDNKNTIQRTPDEELQKRVLRMLGNIGFGPNFEKKDFEKIFYVCDQNIKQYTVEARIYTLQIVEECIKSNSFVCIGTGLGKTYIKLLTALHFLRYKRRSKKVLILAPTKPLCLQHKERADEIFVDIKTGVVTGNVRKNKRESMVSDNQIVVMTPQTFMSMLKDEMLDINDFQLVIFDEVHNMSGKYNYVDIAKIYKDIKDVRMMGLTASLNSKHKKLEEMLSCMGINYSNIITRTESSPDVEPYIFKKEYYKIPIKRQIGNMQAYLIDLMKQGFIRTAEDMNSRLRVIECKSYRFLSLFEKSFYFDSNGLMSGINIEVFNALKHVLSKFDKANEDNMNCRLSLKDWGLLMLFNTAVQMLYKGLHEFRGFMERKHFEKNKNPSQKSFRFSFEVRESIKTLCDNNLWNHPMKIPAYEPKVYNWYAVFKDEKLEKLQEIIKVSASQVLIFVAYRDTVEKILRYLKEVFPEKTIEKFIGQSNKLGDKGMSQRTQQSILAKYKKAEIDIIVATSIAEQGLDFPSVGRVIFYEPITDPTRAVQRSGRTGRKAPGIINVLYYSGKDEPEELIKNIGSARLAKAQKLTRKLST